MSERALGNVRLAVMCLYPGKPLTDHFDHWRVRLDAAIWFLRCALRAMNSDGIPPRGKGQVLRMLNWCRAELRRVSACYNK